MRTEGLPQSWWQGISHVSMTVVGFRIHPSPRIMLGFLSILLDTDVNLKQSAAKDVDIVLRYVYTLHDLVAFSSGFLPL